MYNPYPGFYSFKQIVVLGSPRCGKTRLIKTYIELTKDIEAARKFRSMGWINIDVDGTNYESHIFDAPTHMNWKSDRVGLYKAADVIVLCYSVEDFSSFLCAKGLWLREIKENNPDVPIVLVANKVDIRSIVPRNPSLISHSNGYLTASNIHAVAFVECSAKTKDGVLDVFKVAVKATIRSIVPLNPSLISHSNGRLTASNIRAVAFVECSAKTKDGVLDVFKAAVKVTIK